MNTSSEISPTTIEPKRLLTVLVGSRAHGLERPDSDYDYRHVFAYPLREKLRLFGETKQTQWIESEQDVTGWELGHFLRLATKCNPTILEVFAAPQHSEGNTWPFDTMLRSLLPCVWNPKGVRDAFIGYALNQRTKMLKGDLEKGRLEKYAQAYLRVLYQGWVLLDTGVLPIRMVDTQIAPYLHAWRRGLTTSGYPLMPGHVIDVCSEYTQKVEAAYGTCKHQPNLDRVEAFYAHVTLQLERGLSGI